MKEYDNSAMQELIAERIHSERDRYILRRDLIDDISYERIAEETGLSDRWVRKIAKDGKKRLNLI